MAIPTPTSYYKFESNSNDYFGLYNGTDTSITYSSGKIGNAAVMNATTDCITTTNNSFPTTGDFTISLWINPSAIAGNYDICGGYHPPALTQWSIQGRTSNTIGIAQYDGSTDIVLNFSGTFSTGTWYMLTAVRTGDTMTCYVNGGSATSSTGWVARSFSTATMALKFGFARTSTAMPGTYDEAYILHGIGLSASQVAELYNNGSATTAPFPEALTFGEYMGSKSFTKGLWRLNGNSSSTFATYGTDTNITYSLANGKFGQGAGFVRASASIIDFGYNSNLSPGTSDFTLSCWVKLGVYNQYQGLITSRQGASGYGISMLNTGAPEFYMGNGSLANQFVSSIAITDTTQWHNVIMTRVGNSAFGYVDGVYAGTLNYGSVYNTSVSSGNKLIAGRYYAGTVDGNNLTGNLDEIILEIGEGWSAEKIKRYYTYAKGMFGIA